MKTINLEIQVPDWAIEAMSKGQLFTVTFDRIQAADKEIAQWKKAKELVEKQLTKLSIECADIRLSADKEIATKDAELARLREEARNWRSVAERLEREKQLKW